MRYMVFGPFNVPRQGKPFPEVISCLIDRVKRPFQFGEIAVLTSFDDAPPSLLRLLLPLIQRIATNDVDLCAGWMGSRTRLRRAGNPFRLRGRIDALFLSVHRP